MKKIEEIIRADSESGLVYIRSCVILAFFIDKPVHNHSEELIKLLNRYIEIVPPEALKWSVASASQEEWRETNTATLVRIKSSLAPAKSSKRDLTAFRLSDSGDSAPSYSFRLIGQPLDKGWPDPVTLVQVTFPVNVLSEGNLEEFIVQVRELAGLAKANYGYCSLGFNYNELNIEEAFKEIKKIALRHPGYDVQVNDMIHVEIGKKVRGARWITFLSTELVTLLGGLEKLRKQLPQQIVVEKILNGVMLRAGKFPELGDVNRKVKTPLLREVAKVLEPVTHFNEVYICSYLADGDEDLARKWERRFLD